MVAAMLNGLWVCPKYGFKLAQQLWREIDGRKHKVAWCPSHNKRKGVWVPPEGQDDTVWRALNDHADAGATEALREELESLRNLVGAKRQDAAVWQDTTLRHLKHATLDYTQKMRDRIEDADKRRVQRHLVQRERRIPQGLRTSG